MIYSLKYKGMFKSSYERNLIGVRGSENKLWNNDKDYIYENHIDNISTQPHKLHLHKQFTANISTQPH